jgi:ankyrin repeat protein
LWITRKERRVELSQYRRLIRESFELYVLKFYPFLIMRNVKISILSIILVAAISLTGVAEPSDPTVYQVQKNLKELGYDPGSPDGIWGKKTVSAIKRFQLDNGLPVTGKLNAQTRAKLISEKPPSQVSFIEAIKNDDLTTVKALIAAGADVNAKDKLGETPLHIAAVRGYNEITSLLIDEGVNVNTRNKRGLTPLHTAAWSGHKETVALLIAKGANINAKDQDGVTPLHVSALSGAKNTMTLLIDKGADINAINKDGMTPLHAAALTGQKEAIELLVKKGANINAKNKRGVTPLQIAHHKGNESIVEFLRKF